MEFYLVCVLCIGFMFASFVSAEYNTYECPSGWEEFSEYCYRFVQYPPKTRPEATADCAYDSAYLLTINLDLEHVFIGEQLDTTYDHSQTHDWWTSGKRTEPGEAQFYWEGDGQEIESYFFWHNDSIPPMMDLDFIMYNYNGYQWGWILSKADVEASYICKISKEDIYKIANEERDHSFGVETEDPSNVPRGPYFTMQPRDVVHEPVQNTDIRLDQASIECRADGNPSPQYEWWKERAGATSQVDPATNTRYTIINGKLIIDQPSSSRQDDGQYFCKAGNHFGTVISNTVMLNFGFLNDFPKSPRSPVTATAYSFTSIECNPPSHYPDILYTWYKNSPSNFVRPDLKPYIFISNDGRLYFSEVTADDVGQYYCVVNKPGFTTATGVVSMPTELLVREGSPGIYEPVIGSGFPFVYPKNPKVGDTVRLECWASGTSNPYQLEYFWEKIVHDPISGQDVPMPLPEQAVMSDHNRVVTIPNIRNFDAGTYNCRVSRHNGLPNSKTTQVLLESVPYFIVELKDRFVDVGTRLEWNCIADGNPGPEYDWYLNGTKFTVPPGEEGRITISNNAIIIEEVDANKDNGMYQCVAYNIHGRRYSSAQLKVLSFAPNFNKSPLQANQFATVSGNTTILCRPEAAPLPDIVWYKNNAVLPGDSRVQVLENGNLFISPVQSSDAGRYRCEATNIHGTNSSTGNLTILETVTISQPPEAKTITVNSTSFVFCTASYNLQLDVTYTWYHGDMLLEFEKVFRLGETRYEIWKNPHYKRGSGHNMGGIYIMHAQTEHTGLYKCMVETPVGDKFEREAYITIQGPPSEPAGVYIDDTTVTETSVRIKWKAGGSNGQTIQTYVIEAYNYWEKFWRIIYTNVRAVADETETFSFVVENLRPWSEYELRIRAENTLGTSDPSRPTEKFSTLPVRPDLYPEMVGGGGGKVGDLTITWMPLDEWEENGAGFGYFVYWKPAGDENFGERNETVMGNVGRYVKLLGEDYYYRNYEVAVQAFNEKGQGPMSPIVMIRSAMALPTAIATNVRAQPYNATACKVTWEPVEDNREYIKGKLGGYRLSYWPVELGPEYENAWRVTLNGQHSEGLVIGLEPDKQYYFAVYVWNDAGNGPKSQWFLQRTLRNAPINQPVEVRVYRDGTRIHAYWRGVSTTNIEEPLEGYKVRVWREGEDIKVARDYNAGKETDYWVNDLKPHIRYKLRVFGFSRGGDGTMSSPAIQFTLDSASYLQISFITMILSLSAALWNLQ